MQPKSEKTGDPFRSTARITEINSLIAYSIKIYKLLLNIIHNSKVYTLGKLEGITRILSNAMLSHFL